MEHYFEKNGVTIYCPCYDNIWFFKDALILYVMDNYFINGFYIIIICQK